MSQRAAARQLIRNAMGPDDLAVTTATVRRKHRILVGIRNQGHVALTPAEARELAEGLQILADRLDPPSGGVPSSP